MFTIHYDGSIALVKPLSLDVRDWLQEHTNEEACWWHDALVVEPRYLYDLVMGLTEAGFEPRHEVR